MKHLRKFFESVEITESELKKLKMNVKLTPGMPVNAFLITGSRTFFQYLIAPINEIDGFINLVLNEKLSIQ